MHNIPKPRRVPWVTVYGDFPCRTVTPAVALSLVETGSVTCILGAMQPAWIGRELVTADDLREWVAA